MQTFGQNWPKQQSHGIFATATLLVTYDMAIDNSKIKQTKLN